MLKRNLVVVTGGNGRFAKNLKKIKSNYNFIYPNKKTLDINEFNSIYKFLKRTKPKLVLHLAGLSRPMEEHVKNINKSINLNIIGTSNVVKVCSKLKIKLIYFSTNYVYPSKTGSYNEKDPVLPHNKYGWSKLGGETAVQMYKNSLILRICMTEKPFAYNKAFANMKTNFVFHVEVAKNLFKLIRFKGIINVGGEPQSIFNFAKKYNPKVKKIFFKKNQIKNFPINSTMNISKYKKIMKIYKN